MKILFIIPSYKPAYCYGGTTVVVSELAESLVRLGHSVTIYTTTANGSTELPVPSGEKTIVAGVEVYYFKRITGDHTHVSPALWSKLWRTCRNFDIVHLHSWWSLLIIGAAQICRLKKIIFILSPHGMLSSYTFKHQHSLSKKILHFFAGKRLFKNSILHATTLMEWKECVEVYTGWNGFILFNLVVFPSTIPKENSNAIFTIGYLSRLDPKKGLDNLLTALSSVNFRYRFKIAGSGEDEYIKSLKDLTASLSISDNIEWCGWKDGEEKFRFLESIDLFVLNSFNENFAVVVIESLALGIPVLISENVGLADYVKEKKIGWICKNEILSIRDKLNLIFSSPEDRQEIKSISPGIIQGDFNRQNLVTKYELTYLGFLKKRFI